MFSKPFLILLWSSLLASAAPNFVLGFEYSQWLFDRFRAMATDGSGAIYLLRAETTPGVNGVHSSVTKLSADSKSILWTDELQTEVSGMAVDPKRRGVCDANPWGWSCYRGEVGRHRVGHRLDLAGSDSAATIRLSSFSCGCKRPRVYKLGAKLVRLSADGSAIEYSVTAAGTIYSIAADATGAAFVITDSFLTRFAPDGSVGFKATLANASGQHVVLDTNGNAVVNTGLGLARFDANGGLISSSAFPGAAFPEGLLVCCRPPSRWTKRGMLTFRERLRTLIIRSKIPSRHAAHNF